MWSTDKLRELFNDQREWSNKTFGVGRSPTGPLHHLIKEANEAIEDPKDQMEFADMLILWMDAAQLAGHSLDELLFATKMKQEINRNRQWGKPNENGVIEHVEEEPVQLTIEEVLHEDQSENGGA